MKHLPLCARFNWQRKLQLVAALFFIACLSAKADVPIFGNNVLGPPPGGNQLLNVGYFNGDVVQFVVVDFTPTENLNVSSITLWVTGYSTAIEPDLNLNVGIYNTSVMGTLTTPGTEIAALTGPAPNNGSSAPFTFSDSGSPITLQANQEYCFEVSGSYPGSPPLPTGNETVTLEEGDSPTGEAAYDGTEYWQGTGPNADADTPAFTINTVPEPSVSALAFLSVLLWGGYALWTRRHRITPSP